MKQTDKILTPDNKEKAFRWLRANPERLANIVHFSEQYLHTSEANPVKIGSHEFYTGISRGIYDPTHGLLALWSNLFIRSGRNSTFVYYLNKSLFEEIKGLQKDLPPIVQFNTPTKISFIATGPGRSEWPSVEKLEEQLQFMLEAVDKIKEDIAFAKHQEKLAKEKRILELQQELQALGA